MFTRSEAALNERVRPRTSELLVLRTQDLVQCLTATVAATALLFYGRDVADWEHAVLVYTAIAISPLVARALEYLWPSPFTRLLAGFGPASLGVILLYSNLGPLCDLLHPQLVDGRLAQIDAHIFGVTPSVWLENVLPHWLTGVLFSCYCTYYLWPVAIGLILFAQGREAEFERFTFGYVLLLLSTFACYLVFPAIGPRFYLVADFAGPLNGGHLGTVLEQLFKKAPYFRDCFPSGHTGLVLYCFYSARRSVPRFFWVMLLPGLGLILATLACRFHYGVDLLCAPMFTALAIVARDALPRRLPEFKLLSRSTTLETVERH